jgi:hypothetical protein
MYQLPNQRKSYKEKIANNYEFCKETIDAIINSEMQLSNDYERKLANYMFFNNIINQADFERECNPYGLSIDQIQDIIKPYNKTYNKIQILLGEELKRPFVFKAVLTNPDAVRQKLEKKKDLLREYVTMVVKKELASSYPDLVDAPEEEEAMLPEQIEELFAYNFVEAKEVKCNQILNYYFKEKEIPLLKNEAFKHATIAGEEFVYVGLENNNPVIELCNPLSMFYQKGSNIKYVEDGEYAGYRVYMSNAEIVSKFGQLLQEDDLEKFNNRSSPFKGVSKTMNYEHELYLDNLTGESRYGQYGPQNNSGADYTEVYYVEWKSLKKVGFLSNGENRTIVSEDFVIPKQATKLIEDKMSEKVTKYLWNIDEEIFTLEWYWIPEVWQGVRIGKDTYVAVGPKPEHLQFRSVTNPFKVRLGFHGVIMSATNAPSISIMDRMKPFAYLFLIVMHKLKKAIMDDKGRIFHFDTTMVDPKLGWEKTLYYLTTLGIDFYNPLQNATEQGWSQRGKINTSTDWSTMDKIRFYVELLQAIDEQISDVAGINRQREGFTQAGEAVTNAQNNIAMSSNITEFLFRIHDKFWERVLDSFLNVATYATNVNPKHLQYVLDDMSLSIIEIDDEELSSSDFGVFVSNSTKDIELFNSIKQLALPILQNQQASLSTLVKVLRTDSTEEAERYLKQYESEMQARQEEMSKQQQQLQEQAIQAENERHDKELATKIKVAEITSFRYARDNDLNKDEIPDQLQIEEFKK